MPCKVMIGRGSMSRLKKTDGRRRPRANAELFLGGKPALVFFLLVLPRGRWVDVDVDVVVPREMWLWVLRPEMLVASGHASVTGATSDREKPWTCMLMCADVGGEMQGVI